MKHPAYLALLVLIGGCSSTIEYGRRSLNEPSFDGPHQPPSLIISSTAQAMKPAAAAPAARDDAAFKAAVRLDLKNPSAATLGAVRQMFETGPVNPDSEDDRTVLRRTIVATINRGEYRPADRFVNFRLRIEPVNFEFSAYSGTETDYSAIDIENFSLTKTRSAGLELGGGAPVAAKANLNNERASTETSTTNIDYNTLDIYREAERGIDLSGNTLVNVSLTAKQDERDTQIKPDLIVTSMSIRQDEKFLPAEKASLTTAHLLYLKPRDLTARLTFDYVIRRVLARSNDYAEHDQTVSYEEGRCTNAIIVAARDLDIPRWNVVALHNGRKLAPVNIDSELGAQALTFTNYIDALRFSAWMMKVGATRVGKSALSLPPESGLRLSPKSYPKLVVEKSSERFETSAESPLVCKITSVHGSPGSK
jgi:hypothetical protein